MSNPTPEERERQIDMNTAIWKCLNDLHALPVFGGPAVGYTAYDQFSHWRNTQFDIVRAFLTATLSHLEAENKKLKDLNVEWGLKSESAERETIFYKRANEKLEEENNRLTDELSKILTEIFEFRTPTRQELDLANEKLLKLQSLDDAALFVKEYYHRYDECLKAADRVIITQRRKLKSLQSQLREAEDRQHLAESIINTLGTKLTSYKEATEEIKQFVDKATPDCQDWMRRNKIVFTADLSKIHKPSDEGWWEKIAFSVYTDLVDLVSRIDSRLTDLTEGKE